MPRWHQKTDKVTYAAGSRRGSTIRPSVGTRIGIRISATHSAKVGFWRFHRRPVTITIVVSAGSTPAPDYQSCTCSRHSLSSENLRSFRTPRPRTRQARNAQGRLPELPSIFHRIRGAARYHPLEIVFRNSGSGGPSELCYDLRQSRASVDTARLCVDLSHIQPLHG